MTIASTSMEASRRASVTFRSDARQPPEPRTAPLSNGRRPVMSTRVELQTHFSPTAGGLIRPVNLESIGTNVLRYALVLILVVFGVLKFTAAEAAAIKPLVSNSPLMTWLYSFLSDQGVSRLIGTSELVTAALLAARPLSARAAAVGGALATATFAITLSFVLDPRHSRRRIRPTRSC